LKVRLAGAANCTELPAVKTALAGEIEKAFADGCEVGDKPPQLNRNRHRTDRTRTDTA
jgi:hypothetical protein